MTGSSDIKQNNLIILIILNTQEIYKTRGKSQFFFCPVASVQNKLDILPVLTNMTAVIYFYVLKLCYIMKQQDKEKFLARFRQKRYPRQAILFEYFLDDLFVRIETREGLWKTEQFYLPQTVAFHLFMYVCLTDVKREANHHLLDFFPDWCLEIKPALNCYARWLPTPDLLNCPQLSFERDVKGFYRRSCLTDLTDRAIRFNFGLSADCFWSKEELMKTAFAQDELAEVKPGFDKALDILWQTIENWPLKFLQTVRPFSTLGFLAFLALPQDLFLSIMKDTLPVKLNISGYEDIFFVMENVFQNREMPEEVSFCHLPGESVMCSSDVYDTFVRLFLSLMEEKDANLWQKMKLNAFFYLRETQKDMLI